MERIESLYKKRGYFERFGTDVVITFLLIGITVGINSYSTYSSIISQIKSNWNVNRCKPIYMPFAGIIMPQPGQTSTETTNQNFQYCIQQDNSMVINIALMPFEFGMFIIIEFLDAVMSAITAFMELLQWLKNVVGSIFKEIYEKILSVIIPLMVIIIHLRDTLSKMNGILVTALYSMMNIYNIIVSGVLNMMVLLNNILIIAIAIMLALMILALVFMPTPAFALGFVIYAGVMSLLSAFVVPVIVMYTLMEVFTKSVFKTLSPKKQKIPSIKKPKISFKLPEIKNPFKNIEIKNPFKKIDIKDPFKKVEIKNPFKKK
jgi:hypothetical protein